MPCLTCNTDCSTIAALLPANGCKKTNSSKPTGFYISSYPLPELSSYAAYDPSAPVDITDFTTDFNARLDNTDIVANDVIRCFCASVEIGTVDAPSVEDCDGTELFGTAKLTATATSYDFSPETRAFLQDLSNCNKTVYIYFKTENLLLGAYKGEANCFTGFKAKVRVNNNFTGARGELNSKTITITTDYIGDIATWEQEFITALDLDVDCSTHN